MKIAEVKCSIRLWSSFQLLLVIKPVVVQQIRYDELFLLNYIGMV